MYAAVKRFLEQQGFDAKGEVIGCDIVAVRPGEPPMLVICELKLQFNLDLLLQAADRMTLADAVWLAVPRTRRGRDRDRRVVRLCRLLGSGPAHRRRRRYGGSSWPSRRRTAPASASTAASACCANTNAATATPRPAARPGVPS